MNTVSVHTQYRPMRLGLCVSDGTIEDLRKAVKLTSTLWGGRFNPIIPVGGNQKLSQDLISMFNVDILLPISEGTEIERLIQKTKHLPWSDSRREMFLTGTNGPMPVFLDVFHPLTRLSEVRKDKAQTGFG